MMRLIPFWAKLFGTSHGRPAAAVILIGFTILLFFPDIPAFKAMRLYLFDTYQTYWPRERLSAPAIIVGIDEASLKLCGQWPWPRTQLAALLDKIAACKPAAIGLDIIMPEPDRLSPTKLAQSLPQIEPELRHLLTQLPDNDHLLAASLSRSPVVLGAAGFDVPTSTTASQMRSTPVIQKGGEAAPFVKYFPAVLKSLPILESSAAGQALLNGDMEKGIVRRVPLLACVGDTLAVSLSIEMLRVASGIPAVTARSNLQGIASVRIGDITIPTQPDGEMWVYFSPSIPNRYLSAADIISGRIHADVLERKLILIGLTGQGLLDIVTTSRGERIPGIEVHAQILENIFDQSFLTRPAWIKAAERGIFFLYGLLLLIFVPTMKPRLSPLMALASVATLLVFSWLAYRKAGWLLDAASPSLGLVTIYLSLLISTFVLIDRKRQAAEQALQQEREAAAHIAGEMEAARRIQLGSLPQAETSFPKEGRFDLSAAMEPARVVGGDLYDFYMLDKSRLFFIVGDVSGKGLPASLFMAVTKAMMKSMSMQGKSHVNEILERMNAELAWENPEMLFVTIFAAVLDIDTGAMEYCIAGHDAPWRINSRGEVDRLAGEGNPALCMVDEISYRLENIQLSSGDTLCVVTDGITEAMNRNRELYGTARIDQLLQRHGITDLSSEGLVKLIRDDVRNHVDNAEQSDDLTLLVLRWRGPQTI